ncbi:hypothetical protein DEO72_LG9g2080 [Vigna unguiculata]|uniref:Uncharacterized protein n=1 Tax=Vigna unguiculata TaxID=3917 RepID=A0A4D6N2G9_VIGUN|nr:hypothetical protein DEO72_LG9g2080 [Vigna unguiculata]
MGLSHMRKPFARGNLKHQRKGAFSGFHEELPDGESLDCKAPLICTPVSGFYDELPGGHAYPPGDASRIGSVWMFCVIWSDSDQVKV